MLSDVVVDLREGFEANAWAIDEGVSLHPAFGDTNVPRSSMTRAIVVREFYSSTTRRGLSSRPGQGGAAELDEPMNDGSHAVIRLRRAESVAGDFRVIANSGSTWGGIADEGLWQELPYVLGWLLNDEGSLDFFVAEVTGQSLTSVSHLEFGWIHRFGLNDDPGSRGFTPDDGDGLGGWDLDDDASRLEA